MARMMHLIDAVAPFNASQMNRLFKASMPEGTALSYDKYGKDYKLGKELSGLVGLRAVDVEPEKGIKYKINEYQKNIRNLDLYLQEQC
jgi:predicted transcriptional regulator with HTH domain